MQYGVLGTTGVQVSALALGTMMFGAFGNADQDECVRMIHRAVDAGVNIIDTADVYSRGESEQIVGRALRELGSARNDIVLATKFFNPMGRDRSRGGGSRRWIMRAVEDSLRRIGTDHIDLYQAHRHDWTVDVEETLGALTDLVRQGKVRYLGSSTFPAPWIVEAQWAAQRRLLERYVCEQPQYSIFARSVERDVLPACRRHRMGVIVWSPLAGGWLTGKYRRGQQVPDGSRYSATGRFGPSSELNPSDPTVEARYDLVERLSGIAADAGLTLTELASAFVFAHPAVTSSIIGPRTPEQLETSLATADRRLDAATLDAIDAVVTPGTDAPGLGDSSFDPSLRPEHRRRVS